MLRWSRVCYFALLVFCLGVISSSLAASETKQNDQRNANELRYEKAREILSYMNTSVDACDNFYEYANGNYGKHFKEFIIKKNQWSPLYHAKHLMKQKIIKHLNDTNSAETDIDRKVKQFYKSCLHKPTLPSAYADKLKTLISEFGQMPVLEGNNWRESEFDWVQVVAQIKAKTGLGIIMQAGMVPDIYNNSINRAIIHQPSFILPKKLYYLDEKLANARSSIQQKIQKNLERFLNVTENLARQTAEEILNFEINLSHEMLENIDAPHTMFNSTFIDELQSQYLHSWHTIKYLVTALDLYPSIVMAQTSYLNNLAKVIQRTPKKQIANYIFYIYIQQYIRQIRTACHKLTRLQFQEYLENAMYHKYVTEQNKSYIAYMWQELKLVFEDTLQKTTWLTAATRQLALEKLRAMKLRIDSYTQIDFAHKYATLYFSDYDFLENVHRKLLQNGREARLSVIEKPKHKGVLVDSLSYIPRENILHFPVAYLQPSTLWSTEYPVAINFGGIGTAMAHEISHAFDDMGRVFDKYGNFQHWWDNRSSKNFKDATICLAKQYANYEFRNVYMPELEKPTENMADNVGLKHAYKAYMKWYNTACPTRHVNEVLPLLEYNNKQLFFLAFGQTFGTAYSKNFVYDNGMHMPGEIRVKGAAANMMEFGRAFNCRLGSFMNPFRKCDMF